MAHVVMSELKMLELYFIFYQRVLLWEQFSLFLAMFFANTSYYFHFHN